MHNTNFDAKRRVRIFMTGIMHFNLNTEEEKAICQK